MSVTELSCLSAHDLLHLKETWKQNECVRVWNSHRSEDEILGVTCRVPGDLQSDPGVGWPVGGSDRWSCGRQPGRRIPSDNSDCHTGKKKTNRQREQVMFCLKTLFSRVEKSNSKPAHGSWLHLVVSHELILNIEISADAYFNGSELTRTKWIKISNLSVLSACWSYSNALRLHRGSTVRSLLL